VYLIAAAATWYYPNPDVATSNGGEFIASDPAGLGRLMLQAQN
jgi:hypothetical protein